MHARISLASLHAAVGALTIAAFLITGVYMASGFPELYGDAEAARYRYRANHVYVLFAGLINLVLSATSMVETRPRWLARGASVIVMLAPAVLLAAFFFEPPRASPVRPLTSVGVVGITFAVVVRRFAPREPDR